MFPQIYPDVRTNPGVTVDLAMESGGVGLQPVWCNVTFGQTGLEI